MQQLPPLPRGNQLQPADVSSLGILVIQVHVPQHLLHLLVAHWRWLHLLLLPGLHFLLVARFQALRH